jgi:acyl-CoA thioester hydrolase
MIEIHLFHHQVSAEEIDELRHAGNVEFVKWLQHAAVDHSAALGWPASRYRELGAGWVVRSHRITYLRPAYEGDRLEVRTWVADMKSVTSLRKYEIRKVSGGKIAVAETDWAFIDYATERPLRIPPEVRASFPISTGPQGAS